MRCGHLFNGIGGFALAAHWMGWENVMHCEIDGFCNRVMNHHFPNSYQHEDIRTTNFTIWRGRIDLLTGGFPCQPYSNAGKRKGTADDRHLWPEMRRAIREIKPRWIVPENVRGLTNWNGGLVFDQVQAEMEAEGYEVIPFLLPACGVNAPHRRDRIWFIAHAKVSNGNLSGGSEDRQKEVDIIGDGAKGIIANPYGNGFRRNDGIEQTGCEKEEIEGKQQWEERNETQRQRDGLQPGRVVPKGVAADPEHGGLSQRDAEQVQIHAQSAAERLSSIFGWADFPTQSPVCNGDDGFPGQLADFAVPSRKYGHRLISGKNAFAKWRRKSLESLGNAIVPQVAHEIFKAIDIYEAP